MPKDEASAPEGVDIFRVMFDRANRGLFNPDVKLIALFAAYDKAMLDPNARIPTYMHAAIEGLRK